MESPGLSWGGRWAAILSCGRILPHFERSQRCRFPCEIEQVLQQLSQFLKKIPHRPNNTACPSDLRLASCCALMKGALNLSPSEMLTVGTRDVRPLKSPLSSCQFQRTLTEVFTSRWVRSTAYAPLTSATSLPKDANNKYRFLKHDCFVAEIRTVSKKS